MIGWAFISQRYYWADANAQKLRLKTAKSPTRRARRSDTPFTKAQEMWIIQRSASMTSCQIWQAFVKSLLAPNANNDDMWAPWNPHEEVKWKRQGYLKVMARCWLLNRRMLELRWMVDDNGRPQLVTSQRYQEMLQKQVLPEVQTWSSPWNYWGCPR